MKIFNKLAIELPNGNIAIVQSYDKDNTKTINARVGFIRPGMECLEYISIINWMPQKSLKPKNGNCWVRNIYFENKNLIKERINSLVKAS